MGKKVTVDNLASEVQKILDEYGEEVAQNLDEITRRVGQKGAQALRNDSKAAFPKGTGKYAKGWTYQVERSRLSTSVIIYNKTPGLPHLLEHGHAVVAGGRVAGRYDGKKHIEPVEQKLILEYEKEVLTKL
jgi:hypothetical protein